MELAVFIVSSVAFITRICSAGLIIEIPDAHKSGLFEASIDILESCYTNRTSTVGLAGASIESMMKIISLRETMIPVTLIDEPPGAVNSYTVDRGSRYKLQIFAITVTNSSDLAKTLIQVRNSKWWNHMASFLLIDSSETKDGCARGRKILWEAWKMDLLNSKFMCHHRTRGRMIYTFNPYTSKAPSPWQQENTYEGFNRHVWTLFAQEYRENGSHCNALDFDKTLDLGGYEIRASAEGTETWSYDNPRIKPTIASRVHNITAHILMSSLNAKWKLHLESKYKGPPRDKKGNPIGVTAMVANGSSDICLNPLNLHVWIKYDTTYPIYPASLSVITQYRGHKSQLDKLISVLDRSSRFCVLVVILITLLFFKFHLRQRLMQAILNLVLMLCNAALQKIPKKLTSRIYVGSLFIVVVTIQGIYQGQLASLLTKPVRLPAINSIDDLARSDHTIYGLDVWRPFFKEPAFMGRYVTLLDYNCTGYVLRDPKAACSGEKFLLMSEAAKFELHVADETMGTVSGVYLIRPDWPLEERVNTIYARAVAGDIMKPRYAVEVQSAINKLLSYENEDRDQKLKPLTLNQLGFAFVILAIGLGCATISFIFEVLIHGTALANYLSRIRRRITWIA